MLRAALFDLFGTLLDVASIRRRADHCFPGHGEHLAHAWRDKQLEYTRLRTMSGRYEDFTAVTRAALEHCCEARGLPADPARLDALMAAYRHLAPHADVAAALPQLRAAGVPIGILSNGDPALLADCLRNAGLDGAFDPVLSVDPARAFKTAPAAYALGTAALGVPAADVLFVSSNGWDAAGASWFGFTTCWLNRAGAPRERLGNPPQYEVNGLSRVAELLVTHSDPRYRRNRNEPA